MTAAASLAPPPSAATDELAIRQTLRAARRRFVVQQALRWTCIGILVLLGFLLIQGLLMTLLGSPALFSAPFLIVAALSALVAAAVGIARGWPTLPQVAAILDARAATRDRFQTALDFSARPARSEWEEIALAECARFVAGFPVARWTPIRPPRLGRLAWAAAPLAAALGLLVWHDSVIHRPAPRTAMDAAVDQRADELQKIAAKLRQTSDQTKSPELDKIAEEMKKSAERLKERPASDDQKLKAALGELSGLEAMLKAMKAAQNQTVSPAELAALAAALEASPQTQSAADALKSGQLAQAASELEKLLEQMKQNGDPSQTMQQLAKSMQEQAAKLSEQEKSEVARQMQQAAQGAQSGQGQLSQQALQRLAELLRRAGQNGQSRPQQGSGGEQGQPMTAQQLEQLLNALANMKEGMRPGDGKGSQPGQGQGQGQQSLAIVESFGRRPGGDPGDGNKPSGQPGSEMDKGHGEQLFADKPAAAAAPQGPASRLEGLLGQGESLQQLMGAASDSSKSSRQYRALYDAISPAEQQAIEQENIPLGSRFFIRRYFENIRPQE